MKLTIVFLTVAFLNVSAAGISQSVSLRANNLPLEKVFSAVEKQTGYVFFYDETVLKGARPVTIDAVSMTLEKFLQLTFRDQPVQYIIQKKTIILSRKPAYDDGAFGRQPSSHDLSDPSKDTSADVSGRVVNEKGDAVEGVTVVVKGSSQRTVTDAGGEFSLTGLRLNATLVFTHVSMETLELRTGGKTGLVVRLKEKVIELNDVVVTVNTGYQQLSKERFVGSTTRIDSALFGRQVSTDIINRLDGITNSLLFDKRSSGNLRLQVRGVSTINSNLNPLIILDNFPYTGDINNLNPNDIEHITVLKDAAAASIWGSRSGNGVIVITSKKGKYNQPLQVTVNSNVSVQEKPDPFFYPGMNSADFIAVEQFLFDKGFYNSQLTTPQWYVLSPVVEILNKKKNGTISDAEATARINTFKELDVRKDYDRYVFRNAINQQHYINVTGGNASAKYALSFGYDRNLTNTKGPGAYSRYTINSNTTFRLWKIVEISAGINLSQSESKPDGLYYPFSPAADKQWLYPYAQLADEQGNHLAVPYTYSASYIDTAGKGKLLDWRYRPLDELNLIDNVTKQQFRLLNLAAQVPITSWLKGELRYQYGKQTSKNRIYNSQQTFFTRDLINLFTQINGNTLTRRVPLGGILDLIDGELTNSNFRAQLNLHKKWGSRHELTGLVAGEISENKSISNRSRFYGYNDEVLTYSNSIDYVNFHPIYTTGTAKIPNTASVTEGPLNRLVSFLGNISYSYNDRYTLYASARRDGSNIFGVKTNNKWKPLWSIGGSWEMSKEDFYNMAWLPYLRLRSTFGYTGNANNTISGLPTIRYLGENPYTQTQMAGPNAAPNPNLRWEQVKILNTGIDFTALKNRLSGSIEWFQKMSDDLIAPTLVDPTTGVSTYSINFASLKGTGVDITINTNNSIGPVLWENSIQFSYVKTKVLKYYNRTYAMSNFVYGNPVISPVEGSMAYPVYSYKWGGLDPANGDPQGYLAGKISKNYSGIANDSVQNQAYIGSAFPLYFGNMLNSFSWKGFSLSANITYKLKYYFRKPTISYTQLYNGWVTHADYSKRWQKAGDELITTVPSMPYPANVNRDNFYTYSEVNVEKGDHVRLQDIRLSYSWKNNSRPLVFRNIQVYLYASNLNIFIWKATDTKFDPDYPTNLIPPGKTLAGGININF